MKFTVSIDEQENVAIPIEIRRALKQLPGRSLEVEADMPVKPWDFDKEAFDEAVRIYSGSMREQMLAEGYASVDELMQDIRPR